MSNTPRTDALFKKAHPDRREACMQVFDLAFSIEAELTAATICAVAIRKELEKVQEWQREVRESCKAAMDERCTANEQHCTCVPALRLRVKELERELNEARNEVAICHAANEKLMEELAYYHKLNAERSAK